MKKTENLALNIRKNSLRMVHRAKASHIASALSICDIIAVLYGKVMYFDIANDRCDKRDRFILSKGHACVAIYSVLRELDFISDEDINSYGENFSPLMNHISHKVPGVEFSTGSLGHGLPFAAGKALAAKINNETWKTFVLLSDGEMDEGSNWEALMYSAHHKLESLTIIIDYNKLQSLDTVSNTLNLEPLSAKLESFGCFVFNIDGHNHNEIYNALSTKTEGKPKVIIANTIKGKGVSFMENKIIWHYKNPNDVELKTALKELNYQNA
jgi:transketolase